MKDNQPFLKQHFAETVLPKLMESRGYKNKHQVPVIEKIVINTGFGADADKAWVADVQKEIAKLAGQAPVVTRARMSISNFKLREGMPNGAKVTLRGDRMYDFLHRLIVVALPAIRDFRGISKKLDGTGNYTLGIEDHIVFPEINVEGNKKTLGMDITIVTSAKADAEAFELLSLMGMPFRKSTSEQKAESAA